MSLTQAQLDILDVIEVDLSIESNSSTDYFDPFFGVLPARDKELVLSNGEDRYTVDDLFVFGGLTENGGEFGKNAVAQSMRTSPPATLHGDNTIAFDCILKMN